MSSDIQELVRKPSYEFALINGIQGDPGVYCFSPKTGTACLFDAGSLENLGNKEILKTRQVFITHTHIDHFIGFDRILRVIIPHSRQVFFCGPAGISKNIQGKLRGYLWNLLEPGQLKFRVTEIYEDGTLKCFNIQNDDNFELHERTDNLMLSPHAQAPLPPRPAAIVAELPDGARVESVILDHGTPVAAYLIQGAKSFHLKANALSDAGLEPGPWIGDLQRAISSSPSDSLYTLGSRVCSLGELSQQFFDSSIRRSFAYLTDFSFSAANLTRLALAMTGVEVLFCETTFRNADRSRAIAKKHLTTLQAALIARLIKAKELRPFHISNIYAGSAEESVSEATKYFAEANAYSDRDLESAIAAEISRQD